MCDVIESDALFGVCFSGKIHLFITFPGNHSFLRIPDLQEYPQVGPLGFQYTQPEYTKPTFFPLIKSGQIQLSTQRCVFDEPESTKAIKGLHCAYRRVWGGLIGIACAQRGLGNLVCWRNSARVPAYTVGGQLPSTCGTGGQSRRQHGGDVRLAIIL